MTDLSVSLRSPSPGVLVVACVAAALTLTIAVSRASAAAPGGWPTTCLEVNDIVEAHLDRPGNVGIYQRAYGDQAEAHCQNDHRADVQSAFAWALPAIASAPSSEPAPDGWPTACVGLNDIVEAHLNRPGNVGIYERAYGDQAEANCRADHRADVQAAFAWAVPVSAPSPTAPPPEPTPAGGLPTAPRNLAIQPLDPVTRSDDVRVRAAPPADGGGLPLQGYRWSVTGATVRGGTLASSGGAFDITLYDLTIGEHTFAVNAFNARGDGPYASFNFTVTAPPRRDPTLQAALDLLTSGEHLGEHLASLWTELLEKPEARATEIVFGTLPSSALARYSPANNTITVNSDLRGERLEALATTLAHELWHVAARYANRYPQTREGCFQNETDAAKAAASIWASFGPPTPRTDYEWSIYFRYLDWLGGTLESDVRDRYQEQCNRNAA